MLKRLVSGMKSITQLDNYAPASVLSFIELIEPCKVSDRYFAVLLNDTRENCSSA